MNSKNVFYRAKLPHIQPANSIFFLTFRLADSIPKSILTKVMREKRILLLRTRLQNEGILSREFKRKIEQYYFQKFELLLQNNDGKCWLKYPEIAQLVANKLHSFDKIKYNLICFCIMPNHVHLIIDPRGFHIQSDSNRYGASRMYPLTEAMRFIKGSTARECNSALQRNGKFWQHETYDHYIRDDDELDKIIKCVLYNPCHAGLVNNWTNWPFSYIAKFQMNFNIFESKAR
jgi:REP element-mobilizing transposase RayT